MPRLRQPDFLRNMAFNVLLEYIVERCDEHSVNNSSKKLRKAVDFIKKNICHCIPQDLLTKFCNTFLDRFYLETRPPSHNRLVLKIIMDLGLRVIKCNPEILVYLTPSNANRLRGLKFLFINCFMENIISINLNNFYLRDLVFLRYLQNCDDNDLELIGKYCLKLEELGITESPKVTDRGIRALKTLSKLCDISIDSCPKISLNVIQSLLANHKKLEKLFIYPGFGVESTNTFAELKLCRKVYPSIKEFALKLYCFSKNDLLSIVERFPNLESLKLVGHVADDPRILQSLKNLSELDVSRACGTDWENLKKLILNQNESEIPVI